MLLLVNHLLITAIKIMSQFPPCCMLKASRSPGLTPSCSPSWYHLDRIRCNWFVSQARSCSSLSNSVEMMNHYSTSVSTHSGAFSCMTASHFVEPGDVNCALNGEVWNYTTGMLAFWDGILVFPTHLKYNSQWHISKRLSDGLDARKVPSFLWT